MTTADPTGHRRSPPDGPGGYRLVRLVARGSSADVHLAQHPQTRAWVALKLQRQTTHDPRDQPGVDTDDAARRERDAARRLTHPHIARLVAHGRHEGRDWLATEWAPGRDLAHYTHRRWLLPETRAVHAAWQIALALAHAHRHGVVHRDLKPANVRLHLPRDLLKLTDFGAARIDQGGQTRSGVFLGTPAYMAPEQLRGETPDARTDLYALGAVLFELLTGERPHGDDHLGQLLRRIARGERPSLMQRRPDLPRPLQELTDALLAPNPADRPADAPDVARRLQSLLRQWPGPPAAAPQTPPQVATPG